MGKFVTINGIQVFVLSTCDEDADWIKADPDAKKKDLEASEAALAAWRERNGLEAED